MAENSPSRFRWHDLECTQYNGHRCFSITVPERDLDYDSALPSRGTVWGSCPKWLKQVERVPTSLQSYQLAWHQSSGAGDRIFFFVPAAIETNKGTAFQSYPETHQGIYWPPVLVGINVLSDNGNGYTFKPYYKSAASGPCVVTVEEFFSLTPHNISFTEPMMPLAYDDVLRPGGLAYDASFGRLQLKECLRPSFFYNLVTPTIEVGPIQYFTSQMNVSATNYTNWPSEVVIDDRQAQVFGGYLRRRVTATAPTITAVTP
jgi:hypothetical protein